MQVDFYKNVSYSCVVRRIASIVFFNTFFQITYSFIINVFFFIKDCKV